MEGAVAPDLAVSLNGKTEKTSEIKSESEVKNAVVPKTEAVGGAPATVAEEKGKTESAVSKEAASDTVVSHPAASSVGNMEKTSAMKSESEVKDEAVSKTEAVGVAPAIVSEEKVKIESGLSKEAADETSGAAKTRDSSAALDSARHRDRPNNRGGPQNRGQPGQRSNDLKASRRDNIKFDPSTLAASDDPDEIRKQVEFYFSDSNLPKDRYLIGMVGGAQNKPVEISVIHNFGRMKRFQPFAAVVDALKSSQTLDVIDDKLVVRKEPLNEAAAGTSVEEGGRWVEDRTLPRSIYAKGFGFETPTTQFDIENFFAPYGPINAVRLRRNFKNYFKQSVFVEFSDEATYKAFMALEPKPKWRGTTDLLWVSKSVYVEEKRAEVESGKIPSDGRPLHSHKDNREKHGDGSDWKKRREGDQKRGFRDGERGGGRGRGGRGRGQRGGRGSRGGFGDRREARDPHKVPIIATSTAESVGELPNSKPATSIETEIVATTATSTPAGPTQNVTTNGQDPNATTTNKKRAHEGDDDDGGPQASKKLDTKTEAEAI